MTEQERFEAWFSTRPDFKVWAGMFGNPFSRKADGSYELSVVSTAFDSWQAAQQKEGFVLVPIEPTDEVLDRAVAFVLQVGLSSDYRWTDYMRDLYARFLNLPDSKQQHRSRLETTHYD